MAKKTSKQGKKANKNTEKKTAEVAQLSPIVDKKERKAAEKAAKKMLEKSSEKAAEKPVKQQQKQQQQKQQQKPAKSGKQAQKKDGIFKKIVTYFKNVRLEVKRTTWPSRNEVFRMSLIVIGALLFFGVFIFALDQLMTQFVKFYSTLVPGSAPESTSALENSAAIFLNWK